MTQGSEYKRTTLRVSLGDAQFRLTQQITKGNRILRTRIASKSSLDRSYKDMLTWSDYNKELLKSIADSPELFLYYNAIDPATINVHPSGTAFLGADELRAELREHIRRLTSIYNRLELMPHAVEPDQPDVHPSGVPVARTNHVFIVHGHDEEAKHAVARVIKALDFEPIILQEQPSQGRTIIEKFEDYADVAFAVVLLTPDDLGASKQHSNKQRSRARQNVILELGYFIGTLGRHRVCALHKGDVELPSDILGIVWTPMDTGGAWRFQLGREMRAAGLAVDLNKL